MPSNSDEATCPTPAKAVMIASRLIFHPDVLARATNGTQWSGASAWKKATETAAAASRAGFTAHEAESVAAALAAITAEDPQARVLICGSLYLAGEILKDNG